MNLNNLISLGGFGVVILILAIIFWRQFGLISKIFIECFVKNPLFGIFFWVNFALLILVSFWYPIFWPLTYLALFVTIVKFYEWSDDRFVDDKIGGWVTSQKYTFVQIIPNGQSLSTVGDMENFLTAISAVYGNRSQKDFRTSGKFFDEFGFEIHSNGGRLSMYCRMIKSSSFPVFMTAAQTHFPKVQFLEVEDPCINWPKSWQEMNKKYAHFIGGELAFPKTDLYPTKSIVDLEREKTDNLPLKDPFFVLTSSLEKVDSEDYVVIQFLCRPFDHNKVVGKKWSNEAANLKKELANNAEVARGKGGLIQPYTLQEENLINSVEQKMISVNFATKMRFALFGAKVTSKRYLPALMGYLKIFYTERQAIVPKYKTWEDSDNATWGPFWDKLYWAPEDEKRKREVYTALIKRSGGRGGPRYFWDVPSLAAILHIPNFSLDSFILDNNNLLQTKAAISDVNFHSTKNSTNSHSTTNTANNLVFRSNLENNNLLSNENFSVVSPLISPKEFPNEVPTTKNVEIIVNLPQNNIPNSYQSGNQNTNQNYQNPVSNLHPNFPNQQFQGQNQVQNQSISKSNFQTWHPQNNSAENLNSNQANNQPNIYQNSQSKPNNESFTELEKLEIKNNEERIAILKAKLEQQNNQNTNFELP